MAHLFTQIPQRQKQSHKLPVICFLQVPDTRSPHACLLCWSVPCLEQITPSPRNILYTDTAWASTSVRQDTRKGPGRHRLQSWWRTEFSVSFTAQQAAADVMLSKRVILSTPACISSKPDCHGTCQVDTLANRHETFTARVERLGISKHTAAVESVARLLLIILTADHTPWQGPSDPDTGLTAGHTDPVTGMTANHTDPDTGLTADHTDPDTGLTADHTDPDTRLIAGHTDPDTRLIAGHTDPDTRLIAGHTDPDTGLTAGHTDLDTRLIAGHTDPDTGMTAGHTDPDTGMTADHIMTRSPSFWPSSQGRNDGQAGSISTSQGPVLRVTDRMAPQYQARWPQCTPSLLPHTHVYTHGRSLPRSLRQKKKSLFFASFCFLNVQTKNLQLVADCLFHLLVHTGLACTPPPPPPTPNIHTDQQPRYGVDPHDLHLLIHLRLTAPTAPPNPFIDLLNLFHWCWKCWPPLSLGWCAAYACEAIATTFWSFHWSVLTWTLVTDTSSLHSVGHYLLRSLVYSEVDIVGQ